MTTLALIPSSGKYLNFESHCPMAMKYNIVKMEATRVISNCSNIKDMYPHLNNLRNNFIKSGYPLTFINDIFIPLIKNRELGKDLMENRSKQVNNDDKEFIIRLPFINEAFTRIAKSNIKKAGIKARVVICPGTKLKSQVTTKKSFCTTNNCTACNMNIPCDIRNFVYKATCLKCNDEYLGCSARPA